MREKSRISRFLFALSPIRLPARDQNHPNVMQCTSAGYTDWTSFVKVCLPKSQYWQSCCLTGRSRIEVAAAPISHWCVVPIFRSDGLWGMESARTCSAGRILAKLKKPFWKPFLLLSDRVHFKRRPGVDGPTAGFSLNRLCDVDRYLVSLPFQASSTNGNFRQCSNNSRRGLVALARVMQCAESSP